MKPFYKVATSLTSIRLMKEADLGEVAKLAVLANPFARDEKNPDRVTDEYMKNVRYWLENFPELAFVAEENGGVVGYVAGEVRGEIGVIEDIAVAEAFQRKGIGSALMQRELEALRT
ncbi:hypothetical protein DRO34_06120, partial [Candidatus Bathyarchaeota archaeon]